MNLDLLKLCISQRKRRNFSHGFTLAKSW